MNTHSMWMNRKLGWALSGLLACGLLTACGSGSSDNADQPPVATISSPASNTTFKAGDDISFSGSAFDAEDGTLPASRLSWWVDLHHDTHTHPVQQPTVGGSGTVSIPVRGETSDNIWYRFHLSATDSAGHTVEVTRDVLPRKSQVTLATQPAGLQLTLDGQPVTGPSTFTGVQGIERDLGAAEQVFNGHRYAFATWSDGGAAAHTISTPVANTTYTASFNDLGPVTNQAPTVSLSAATNGVVGTAMTLSATAADSDGTIAKVQFYDGATLLGEDTSGPYTWSWTPTSAGAHNLSARATDNGGATTISAVVTVTVDPASGNDTTVPTITLTAPTNLADGLTGTQTLTATATDNVGVVGVEFQVDGVIVGGEDTVAPYTASWNTANYPSGQHIVRARARDAAGNFSAWATSTVRITSTAAVPQGFTKNESWITGLSNASAFAQASDGRLFIAQQGGQLRVVKNGVLQAAAFVTLTVDSAGERGLIGVALHPNFPTTPWVYVHYTSTDGGSHNRVSRFMASGDVATGTEQKLVDLPNLSGATNHNGGALHFGLDGKLYVGVGENADSSHSPDLTSPLGKLLRFNEDASIPSDNPFFASGTGLAKAIWAYGLRNPFTFAVQPVTGRIHINDVGQNTWEEINLGTAGANYGWPSTEGLTTAAGITGPLFTYKHSDASPVGSGAGGFFVGFCIAGGAFYPTSGPFPASYRGGYFFSDYVSKFVGRVDLANGNATYAFTNLQDSPVDMLVGGDGALYLLTRSGITRVTAP
ncbi:MAG: PQQ-dependent sugar dehydrogenase [Rhizobacter sp.]